MLSTYWSFFTLSLNSSSCWEADLLSSELLASTSSYLDLKTSSWDSLDLKAESFLSISNSSSLILVRLCFNFVEASVSHSFDEMRELTCPWRSSISSYWAFTCFCSLRFSDSMWLMCWRFVFSLFSNTSIFSHSCITSGLMSNPETLEAKLTHLLASSSLSVSG